MHGIGGVVDARTAITAVVDHRTQPVAPPGRLPVILTAAVDTPRPTTPVATPSWTSRFRVGSAATNVDHDGVVDGRLRVATPDASAGGTAGTSGSITYRAESTAHHGRAVVRPDGSFTYNAATAALRACSRASVVTDSFRVAATDGGRHLSLTVNPTIAPHDAPSAVAFSATMSGDASVEVNGSPRALTLGADGRRLFSVSSASSTVSILDTATMTVTAQIPLDGEHTAAAVDDRAGLLYVALHDAPQIDILDIDGATIAGSVLLPTGVGFPVALAVSPDHGAALVVTTDGHALCIDTTTRQIRSMCAGLGIPRRLVVADDARAYALDESGPDAVVHVLTDPMSAPRIAGRLVADGFVCDLAVGPRGDRLFLLTDGGHTVTVVDTTDLTRAGVVALGAMHAGIAVCADGQTALVSNPFDDTVSAIDLISGTVVAQSHTGEFPRGLVVAADGARVYAATADSVSVISRSIHGVIVGQADGIERTYTVVTGPARGRVNLATDGAFRYTGDLPVVTADRFTVLVDDGLRTATTAIVEITAATPSRRG